MTSPIGWCDITLNPITGCRNHCKYCYAEKFAKRLAGRCGYPACDPFRPTLHEDKLQEILELKGKGKRVFLSSMGDWFSEEVQPIWIERVLQAVAKVPQHHFLVLTKRPDRIFQGLECHEDLGLPENLWIGVSVTCQDDLWRIDALRQILPTAHKFVSFEPLHGPIDPDLAGIEWAIIGAESGNRKGRIVPERQWVESLVDACTSPIPVFMKSNLGDEVYHHEPWAILEQFPECLE